MKKHKIHIRILNVFHINSVIAVTIKFQKLDNQRVMSQRHKNVDSNKHCVLVVGVWYISYFYLDVNN